VFTEPWGNAGLSAGTTWAAFRQSRFLGLGLFIMVLGRLSGAANSLSRVQDERTICESEVQAGHFHQLVFIMAITAHTEFGFLRGAL
jgi:hypothetical protein